MKISLLGIGRIFFMVPFLMIGMHHFMFADTMAHMLPSWLPGGTFWIYLTGVCDIAAAVAIITGIQARLAGILASVLLLLYVVLLHAPAMMSTDSTQSMMGMIGAMKDTGLAGASLIFSYVYTKRTANS